MTVTGRFEVRLPAWSWIGAALALALAVHAPSLSLGFAGDDFEWWLQARKALDDPALLLADAGGFYRPANTWSLALDHLLFGTHPAGYHATNLGLHLLCGTLLWALLGRLGVGPAAGGLLAALWLCSPYSLEPAQQVAIRFELLLLAAWLALTLAWPAANLPWTSTRRLAAAACFSLMVFAKETWVVVPGLVLALEAGLRRSPSVVALRRASLVALAPLLYVIVYFQAFPGDKGGYYSGGLASAAKVPHAWAVFCGLRVLHPVEIPFAAVEALALLMMAAVAWFGWRHRSSLVGLGFAFFLLPLVPILPVGFMTSRYTTIPLVGFLLAAAGWFCIVVPAARHPLAARLAVGSMGLVMLIANLAWLRGDMEDGIRSSDLHASLIEETRRFLRRERSRGPFVAVRAERDNPLLALALEVRGVPKIYYPRHADPYALIDWSALWSYVLEPAGGPLWEEAPLEQLPPGPVQVIEHRRGHFAAPAAAPPATAQEVMELRRQGERVKLIRPWRSR